MAIDKKFLNVVLLSLGCFLLFSAFQTTAIIQKTVMENIALEDPEFTADGYTSLAIVYAAFAVANWIAPSMISILTPKWTMVVAVVPYILYMASFLKPITWVLYFLSALVGVAGALFWTGQGTMLTICSDKDTIVRNSGIFSTVMPASLLAGNIFVFFEFQGQSTIAESTRTTVFAVLIGIGTAGHLVFLLLRPFTDTWHLVEAAELDSDEEKSEPSETSMEVDACEKPAAILEEESPHHHKGASHKRGPKEAFVHSVKLLFTANMAMLTLTFIFMGLALSFFSGVYSAAIGFTQQFGEDTASYVGVSGMLIGAGGTVGGIIIGTLGRRVTNTGRAVIVLVGSCAYMLAFILIFVNLPNDSVFGPTAATALIESRVWLALICSFLLGFADCCFNTQLLALLGTIYAGHSAPAFALFRFIQTLATAAAFFYTHVSRFSFVGLNAQLLILSVTCVAGGTTFCMVIKRQTKGSM